LINTLTRAKIIIALLLSSISQPQLAQEATIGALYGEENVKGIKIEYIPYSYNIDWLNNFKVDWSIGFNYWEYGNINENDTNLVLSIVPVLSSEFTRLYRIYPVKWEVAIGFSLLKEKQFAGKDLGSNFQFQDHIGLSVGLNPAFSQSIRFRIVHYSNGGLNDKNPGINFISLSYKIEF
jgi:hypothetical protein